MLKTPDLSLGTENRSVFFFESFEKAYKPSKNLLIDTYLRKILPFQIWPSRCCCCCCCCCCEGDSNVGYQVKVLVKLSILPLKPLHNWLFKLYKDNSNRKKAWFLKIRCYSFYLSILTVYHKLIKNF